MTLRAIIEAWGPSLVTPAVIILMTLIEITPIKLNPWSAIMSFLGSHLNSGVTARLDAVQKCQTETRKELDKHIKDDDERNANLLRSQILRFNDELVHDKHHTKEHFDEMLKTIRDYERYCETHDNYKNSVCVHAIANINRVYDELLESHDFL